MSAPARTLPLGRVGDSLRRVDGIPKTTGEFAYSSDLQAAGMLWGHTLRSPHAHARIVEIDISDALTVPGEEGENHRRRDQTAGEAAQEIAAAQVRERRNGEAAFDDEDL